MPSWLAEKACIFCRGVYAFISENYITLTPRIWKIYLSLRAHPEFYFVVDLISKSHCRVVIAQHELLTWLKTLLLKLIVKSADLRKPQWKQDRS